MANYPYILTPSKIPSFLRSLQAGGIPQKLTQSYLEKLGYRSSNDRKLITIMRFVGFVDDSGAPTETWRRYRDKNSAGATLAQAIRDAYRELYTIYPDAHARDQESLRNYFAASSDVGERAVSAILSTFHALARSADFDAQPPSLDPVVLSDGTETSGDPTPADYGGLAPVAAVSGRQDVERYQSDGILIVIRPNVKTIERARKFLEVVELALENKPAA